MSKYRITNNTSGQYLGTYIGKTPAGALDAMAQNAGYQDHAHACEVTGFWDDLIVEEVDEEDADFPFDVVTRVEITDDQIRALQMNAAAAGDLEMVKICQAALDGSERHRAECLRVIGAAKEMEDQRVGVG